MIGVSAGGLRALTALIPPLPADFAKVVVVVQHVREGGDDFVARHLNGLSALHVKEAEEKEAILPGTVYVAPAGYHLLIEDDRSFGLSADPPVSFARPSIDVLFETAAEVYSDRLAGLILTGANADGARGLAAIKRAGGLTLVQDPETAESPVMPRAAIAAVRVDHVLALDEITLFLSSLKAAEPRTGATCRTVFDAVPQARPNRPSKEVQGHGTGKTRCGRG